MLTSARDSTIARFRGYPSRLDQSELAGLAKLHITTIVRLEAFDAQQVRGQSGIITAVVNALAKAGIELGENGSIFPRPKGKPR